jgi:8-oxo-dGTP diphosphatase
MRRALKSLDVEIVGLKDLNCNLPQIEESGKTPLENARIKAYAYYKAFQTPVFSCDSGLYLKGIPEEHQPGVHVKRIKDIELSDNEMLTYYSNLAAKFGNLPARYQNAICFILDEDHVYESMDDTLSGDEFLLVEKPHPRREPGFPLDSISVHKITGQYYYDMEANDAADELALDDGFYKFFRSIFSE